MVWRIEKSEKIEWNGMEQVEWVGQTGVLNILNPLFTCYKFIFFLNLTQKICLIGYEKDERKCLFYFSRKIDLT